MKDIHLYIHCTLPATFLQSKVRRRWYKITGLVEHAHARSRAPCWQTLPHVTVMRVVNGEKLGVGYTRTTRTVNPYSLICKPQIIPKEKVLE